MQRRLLRDDQQACQVLKEVMTLPAAAAQPCHRRKVHCLDILDAPKLLTAVTSCRHWAVTGRQ